ARKKAPRGSGGRPRLSGRGGAGRPGTPQACAPNRSHPSLSTWTPAPHSVGVVLIMSDSAQESQKRHFSKIRPHVLARPRRTESIHQKDVSADITTYNMFLLLYSR